VEVVPEFLGGLENLKYLLLRNNRIREVPRGVFESRFLKVLELEGNLMHGWPGDTSEPIN